MQKQRLQGALVGFNLGVMIYFLIRYMPLFFAGRNVSMGWFVTNLLIALVVGAVAAGVGYGVTMAMQK
jgi:hypothetical protein